jgi:hypothetical protein
MNTPATPYLQRLQAEISERFRTALTPVVPAPTAKPLSLDEMADIIYRVALKALDRE